MQLTLHLHRIMECSCIDTARCLLSGTLHCLLYYSLFLCCNVDLFVADDRSGEDEKTNADDAQQTV